jgi:rSAM/selenodomain-associated transferase 1
MGDEAGERLRSTCAMAVMAKASFAGRTKTRLVPPLTEHEAAQLNTQFLRDCADNLLAAGALADANGWMAYSPAGSEAFFREHLPDSIGLLQTVRPTLGECLCHAAETLLSAGHGAVCLINSDSPTLPVGYLVTAAQALAAPGDRIVLGPATDGGYYLIGMKRLHAGIFEGISWSTNRVLEQTLARAEDLGLAVFSLPSWYDVDDAGTLQTLIGEVIDGRPFRATETAAPAAWTRAYLAALIRDAALRERLSGRSAAGGVA